ncbi:MAG: hypothetical protein ACKPKO_54150, partial [Candidatus Fonsibacter sp.]
LQPVFNLRQNILKCIPKNRQCQKTYYMFMLTLNIYIYICVLHAIIDTVYMCNITHLPNTYVIDYMYILIT